MSRPSKRSLPLTVQPVYLAARAINNLRRVLPAGAADFTGIVLLTMFTGQLVHHQGSLARAALPFVVQLRWGWHRVERALERGQFSLDTLFERAFTWCMECLPVEAVRLGSEQRTVQALDSSTLARWRARKPSAVLGKGYCHRAQRAVRANIGAALTSVVRIRGVRVGLGRRTRLAKSGEHAVAALFRDLPVSPTKRLLSVDAGIATVEQFAAATAHAALVGRLRKYDASQRGAVGSASDLANSIKAATDRILEFTDGLPIARSEAEKLAKEGFDVLHDSLTNLDARTQESKTTITEFADISGNAVRNFGVDATTAQDHIGAALDANNVLWRDQSLSISLAGDAGKQATDQIVTGLSKVQEEALKAQKQANDFNLEWEKIQR